MAVVNINIFQMALIFCLHLQAYPFAPANEKQWYKVDVVNKKKSAMPYIISVMTSLLEVAFCVICFIPYRLGMIHI